MLTTSDQRGYLAYSSLLVAFATPLLLLLPFLWDGSSSFLLFQDAQDQTYAWWQKLAHGWNAGYLPLWDANIYSGRSFAGEIQASVYYPLTWLWLVLFAQDGSMPRLAIELSIVLHFSIASSTMWCLLRHWKFAPAAALFGALSFALMGPVAERAAAQPNIFFGLCWLPLAVQFASLHVESGRTRFALAAGAVIGLQVLSGHAQPAIHTALLCGVLCSYFHWRREPTHYQRLRAIARSGAPMIAALVLVALPQLLLSMEYLSDAYRWVGPDPIGPGESVPYRIFSRDFSVAPMQLWSLIDPWRVRWIDNNTLHLSVLGLLMIAMISARKTWRERLKQLLPHWPWMLVVSVFALLAMLGHLTPLAHILRKLPVLGQIRQLGRYAILFQFCFCVFAVAAFTVLQQSVVEGRRQAAAIVALMATGVLASSLYLAGGLSKSSIFTLLLALATLATLLNTFLRRRLFAPMALAALLCSAWLYRPLTLPAAGSSPLPEQAFAELTVLAPVLADYGQARIILDESTGLPKNYADAHSMQSRLGHSATMYRPYFDFLAIDWSLNSEINDLLNMRYVLTRNELDLPLLGRDEARKLNLYQRPSAYPRLFLASRYGDAAHSAPESLTLEHYDDHRIEFRFSLTNADTVVVSELTYPGWCAFLNDQPTAIHNAVLGGREIPLRAIKAPPGDHRLRFEYRPFAARIGGCS
ncbi:hypothetical protein [Pseudomarimonas arenosa]|uniref:YfhO family protein n=1 Tax=Pseudomarimonas arenosa TaxID=2774145 RepID=A0AAW3ZNL9_9GAMM|nr:hypothetical protein [Pseudomarimonas arenosa]MBD8527134.1 hypothetical protein [Pseudomarimonas arenosa]